MRLERKGKKTPKSNSVKKKEKRERKQRQMYRREEGIVRIGKESSKGKKRKGRMGNDKGWK